MTNPNPGPTIRPSLVRAARSYSRILSERRGHLDRASAAQRAGRTDEYAAARREFHDTTRRLSEAGTLLAGLIAGLPGDDGVRVDGVIYRVAVDEEGRPGELERIDPAEYEELAATKED